MKKEIEILVSEFRNSGMSLRDFVGKITALTGSAAAAIAILPAPGDYFSVIELTQEADNDLVTGFIKYPAETGDMIACLARPKAAKPAWERAIGFFKEKLK